MLLDFNNTQEILNQYKIPYVKSEIIEKESDLIKFARRNKYPLVLKIDSKRALHKTELGGVLLDIKDKKTLLISYKKIKRVAKKYKGQIIIQKHIDGISLIIGAKKDPIFGNIIIFGLGGIFTEVLDDTSIRLAPVKKQDAVSMIEEIKGYKILQGYRGKAINIKKIQELILELSSLIEKENVQEIDFNPVIVNNKDIFVIDAKILK
jgi:succinyl-CoA synthetase beta subunit